MRITLRFAFTACFTLFALHPAAASAQIVGGEWVAQRIHYGSDYDAQFGGAVAAVGDVDGDGCTDYLIGAEFADPFESNCGSAELFSGKTGASLWLFEGADNSDGLGAAVAGPGDLDGDGIPDVVACAPRFGFGAIVDRGAVYAFSGRTKARLWRFDGIGARDQYGLALAAAGDSNGDGYADLLAGAAEGDPQGLTSAGYVHVHHGLDGTVLLRLEGTAAGGQFGASVASPGDLTGDGIPDILVGAPGADPLGLTDAGSIFLHSGATGSLLHRWDGLAAGDRFGSRIAVVGDVNGDGFIDALISAPDADPGGRADAGSAVLLSQRTGEILHRWAGAAAGDHFGLGLAGGEDLDGDAVPDLAIGAPHADPGGLLEAGEAFVFSGANGALIDAASGSAAGVGAGTALALLADADGGGKSEWLLGSPREIWPTTSNLGVVRLRRHDSFLRLSASDISITSGGVVTLSLEFPADAAFHAFAILISRSGTGPTQLGGLAVPLTPDSLFAAALAGRLPAYLPGFRGLLGSAAQSGAAIAPAPGQLPASLAGATLHFAAVVRPAGGSLRYSSSASDLTILP